MTWPGRINIEEIVRKRLLVATSSKKLIKVSLMTGDMTVNTMTWIIDTSRSVWRLQRDSTLHYELRIISPKGLERATYKALSHVSELILFILLIFSNMIISWLWSLLGLKPLRWYFMLRVSVCLNNLWSKHNVTCACFLYDLLLYLIGYVWWNMIMPVLTSFLHIYLFKVSNFVIIFIVTWYCISTN